MGAKRGRCTPAILDGYCPVVVGGEQRRRKELHVVSICFICGKSSRADKESKRGIDRVVYCLQK